MPDVVMPRLSDSMEEGTILKWLKSNGDEIAVGDELVEIETDKATMTYESDAAGTLAIVANEGATLPIGDAIATIGDGAAATTPAAKEKPEAEADEPAQEPESKQASDEEPEAEPEADGDERDDEEPAAAEEPADEERFTAEAQPEAPAPAGSGNGGARSKASPVARRIADERGVDISTLEGSGPGGRIVKADVEAAQPAAAQAPAPAEQAAARAEQGERAAAAPAEQSQAQAAKPIAPAGDTSAAPGAKGEVTAVEPTRTQALIARRMAEAKATIPEFTVSLDVDMEACVQLRGQLKSASADAVPSYNDMVIKASALALREFPHVNGSYRDARFELHSRINVGLAVAGDDTLVVPTIFDADGKSLGEIARESRSLAGKVREGKIAPPDVAGGTFTVSNLGMLGISRFTAVISPPQAAILAVGEMAPRAVVREGEIVARNTMTLTLTSDHRIVYGAEAARFLGRVRALLEEPIALAL